MRIRTVKPSRINTIENSIDKLSIKNSTKINILRESVIKDLNRHPILKISIQNSIELFIKWCSCQRLSFSADINEEVSFFIEEGYANTFYKRLKSGQWSKITQQVFLRDNFTCKYCGATDATIECDHIIPISKGGSNEIINLASSCMPCNRSKGDKDLEVFLGKRKEYYNG